MLVAAGGRPGFQGSYSSTEFLHPGASHWIYGPELAKPMDGASAAFINGKIIQAGGFGDQGNEVRIDCPYTLIFSYLIKTMIIHDSFSSSDL